MVAENMNGYFTTGMNPIVGRLDGVENVGSDRLECQMLMHGEKNTLNFISKKTWPYYFQLMVDGKKNTDLRLADFDVKPGDVIVFQEWDPVEERYTKRELSRLVENVNHVNLDKFHTLDEIEEFGHYIIETKKNVIY